MRWPAFLGTARGVADHREVEVFERGPGDRQFRDLATEPGGQVGDHGGGCVGLDAATALAGQPAHRGGGAAPATEFGRRPDRAEPPGGDGGAAFLLTAHYLDEAEALATRVAVIASSG